MRQPLFLLFCLSIVLGRSLTGNAQPDTITVMAWNILHGANDIPDGRYRAIEIIKALDPDIILMVETYGSGKEMADSLSMHFHLIEKEGTPLDDEKVNLSIFSRFPFGERLDTDFPFYLGGREISIRGKRLRLFSNWFHYLPWHDEPETMGLSAEELLAWEKTGKKWEMVQKVRPYFEQFAGEADSVPLIVGGDMNTLSHLDWTERTQAQHNGLIVPWQTTKVLEELGLVDSYRQLHPDPQTHPGITWDTKGIRDEHRIDFIFYKGPALTAIASDTYNAHLGEEIVLNGKRIPYPSDHGIVVTTFVLKE